MRTTLDVDDDVLEAVRAIAGDQRRSLGRVVSDLVRRGLAPRQAQIDDEDGFPVFHVGPRAPAITGGMVQVALDEW